MLIRWYLPLPNHPCKNSNFGEDANWGRIITAAGYSGAEFDPNLIDISIGSLMVCKNGTALDFDEGKLKKY